jgi:hypothetical protein
MGLVSGATSTSKAWLRQLDVCLTALEEAHERDEQLVSQRLSGKISPLVPGVLAGMPVAQALDLVFEAQYQCMKSAGTPDEPDARHLSGDADCDPSDFTWQPAEAGGEPIDAVAARALTDRIKTAANDFSLLLLEAQERQAWRPLGYRTWERYVRQEFGLSRTRSYELLDHGRLIRAIREATGVITLVDIPPYTARKVKPYLGQFIASVTSRVAGKPQEEVASIISEMVRQARPGSVAGHVRVLQGRDTPQLSDHAMSAIVLAPRDQRSVHRVDVQVLWTVVEYLAAMPPAAVVAVELAGLVDGPTIERAAVWLAGLAGELRAAHAAAASA